MASLAQHSSVFRSVSAGGGRGLMRGALLACLLGLLLGAGCGGDDEPHKAAKQRAPAGGPTAPADTTGGSRPPVPQPPPKTGKRSPEEQPGGAGDEQPARVPASFTGRGGRISPRTVHVPPYISVLVRLRSVDGLPYRLRFPGATIVAGVPHRKDSTTMDGLRPGSSVRGVSLPGGSAVRVVADAEPGP
ncbi:MAG: hypothetical protein ABR581_06945 [Thermoleophilaceae bacterium]